MHKFLWIAALALTLLMGALLLDTEGRYVQFIQSLGEVEAELRWVGTQMGTERTILTFEAVFHNTSELPMWVEALNTQLYLGGEYAGAHSISEGNFQVPAGGQRVVPLRVTLWSGRTALLRAAQAQGAEMRVRGRARVRLQVGKAELKAFYRVGDTFPLSSKEGDHGR